MTTIPPNPEEALVTISTPERDTVRVRDRVESSRFEIYCNGDIELQPASTEDILFPIDVAASLAGDWSEIVLPMSNAVCIHDESGNVIRRITREEEVVQLENGKYLLELIPAPMKIFILVRGSLEIQLTGDRVTLDIDRDEDVILGSRSPHERPAGTITTTPEPQDVMSAVSQLSSALKTTSPERSWPTLRGYPPKIKAGDTLNIPRSISRPDTGVKIQIPYTLEAIFQVTPLAYYTAAEVEPLKSSQSKPALVAGDKRIPLAGDLSTAAAGLLQKNFMLDSIVRSEGIYPFSTRERTEVEGELPWNPDTVYELPLAERIAAYEDVDEETVDKISPTWPLTVDVVAKKESIPALNHLAEELAVVRIPEQESATPNPQPEYIKDFIRADGSGTTFQNRTTDAGSTSESVITPAPWETQIHTSLLQEYPLGSNKTTIRAFERHIEREAPQDHAIEVNVVCNDDDMREEDVVTEFYGVRDLLEFEVNVHYNLNSSEFKALLQEQFDLIHYIGHVDDSGVKCQDGYVDIRTDVDSVGFDAFLLNACRSVEQGEALLDIGAVGGIATLYDVPNSSATRMGRTLSRLLNRGFTIRSALEIARNASFLSKRWTSLGDGRVSLTQAESVVPSLLHVEELEEGYALKTEWFETDSQRVGTLIWPNTDWGDNHILPSSATRIVSEDDLIEVFSLEVMPVISKGELYWTDEISPEELRGS